MPLITFGFVAQPRFNLLARQTETLRLRADDARTEAVTGLHADPARALGGRTASLVQIERSLAEITDHAEIISLAEGRTSVMQAVLQSAVDNVNAVTATGVTALASNGAKGLEILGEEARLALNTLTGGLNTFFAGRALFSGDGADLSPLAEGGTTLTLASDAIRDALDLGGTTTDAYNAVVAAFAVGGDFDTAIYRGGTGDAPLVQVAADESVAIGVRADDETLRVVLRDLAVLAAAGDPTLDVTTEERADLARAAIDALRNSVLGLAGLQGALGVAEERIADVKARNIAAEATLTLSYNAIAGTDQYEAAAAVTAIESQLETAYLTTTRLTNLSLANFLR